MSRLITFGPAYARARTRLSSNPETRAKLASAVLAIAAAPTLPESADVEALMPPGLACYVRRAPGLALWVWFTFDDVHVSLRALTDHPPP